MDLKVATHNIKLMDVIVHELCQKVFRPCQAYLQTLYITKRIHRTKKRMMKKQSILGAVKDMRSDPDEKTKKRMTIKQSILGAVKAMRSEYANHDNNVVNLLRRCYATFLR